MRVLRGRATSPEVDQRRTQRLVDRVAGTGEPALRVWRPPRQVVFGRRDRHSDGYERARDAASDRGYPVTERQAGGRAVAFTGDTVALALAEPVADSRRGIQARYERVLAVVQQALSEYGTDVSRGEPADSFCPGSHSLRTRDGKVVGLAQRVRQDVAFVAGVVVVDDAAAVADVVGPVYDALGVPFDPASVGSVGTAKSPSDAEAVVDALEVAFTGESETDVETVRET